MIDPFATLTIDTESDPGAWADAIRYAVNIRVSDFKHDEEDSRD